MTFLPDDFKPPAASGTNYTKFVPGKTTIRVLNKAINGWVVFEWDKENQKSKPHRFKRNDKPISGTYLDETGKPAEIKYFFTFLAWNHDFACVQVCEVKQKSIWERLVEFYQDPDWGDPKQYDVVVDRSGDGLNTTYKTLPKPPTALSEDTLSEIREKLPLINLEALYTGDDPFAEMAPKANDDDPFGTTP